MKTFNDLPGVATLHVLREVAVERRDQDECWGEQNYPDGTGGSARRKDARLAKEAENRAFAHGEGTWRHILTEEVAEAFAEGNPTTLREELIQVAAVAVAWVEAIDRRSDDS